MNWFIKTIISHALKSIPEKSRSEIAVILQAQLADSIDLMMKAKKSHLNVTWPSFAALPELFDKVFKDTDDYLAILAENRILLGRTATGTVRDAGMPKYPLDVSSGHNHVAELAHAITSYGDMIREAIARSTVPEDSSKPPLLHEGVLQGRHEPQLRERKSAGGKLI